MPSKLPYLMLLTGFCAAASAESPVNPFARPETESKPAPSGDIVASARPELYGVIVAGPRSIANLNGTLLAIGEELAGYELATVSEESATFIHDGDLVTLELIDPDAEDE